MFTVANFIRGIEATIPTFSVKIQNEQLMISQQHEDTDNSEEYNLIIGEIPLAELQGIESELSNDHSFNELTLGSTTSFEVAVQNHNRMRAPLWNPERKMYAASEHNYEFCVSKASAKFVFSLLCHAAEHSHLYSDFNLIYFRPYRQESFASAERFFDLFRIFTAKIVSVRNHQIADYKLMFDSYLFNISYNYNITLSVAEFSKGRRPAGRRNRRIGQLFPYKNFDQKLTKYYHQAIATDIPFTQYLAFYHVAEYFFKLLSEQDTYDEIKDFITRPSFYQLDQKTLRNFTIKLKRK